MNVQSLRSDYDAFDAPGAVRQPLGELAESLARTEKGMVVPCVANVIQIIARDPILAGMCCFNEFLHTPVLSRSAPSPLADQDASPGPYPRQWQAADVSYVQSYVQSVWCKTASKQDTEDAMLAVAGLNRFHPIRDWLGGLKWDGTPRLDTWLVDAFGAADTPYTRAISAKLLIASVRRVRRPGCKYDYMVIFEGPQGLGKSKLLKLMFGEDWFTDSLPQQLESRDAALGLQGAWCVEFAEIEQIIRSEVEIIKAFLSRSTDRFRAPYGRAFLSYPRQCVLVGTTNDAEYLRDATGNRRFWPVRCTRADAEWVEGNREQIWAEAAAREAAAEDHWITEVGVTSEAVKAQTERLQADVWDEHITDRLCGRTSVTMVEVLRDIVGVPMDRQDRRAQMRAAAALKRDGWAVSVRWESGKCVRKWERSS